MNSSPVTIAPVELLRKYDRPGPRYTSYPTVPTWPEQIDGENYRRALSAASLQPDKPLAIYCHIPFCKKRCFYCGCNTCVVSNQSRTDRYLDALTKEISCTGSLLGKRRPVTQLHFGGGTPTFIGVEGLRRVLDLLENYFLFPQGCEKSIEIDPRVTTKEQLEFLAGRDFSRLSLGIQDLDEDVQKAIGRTQPIKQVEEILTIARSLDFGGINFDLIYGLPRQSLVSFTNTLQQVIALQPDRIALYSFAYLPSLRANQALIKEKELPSTELKYQLFATAAEKLTTTGYCQIGMDHFALPADELSLAQADGRLYRNFMGYTVRQAPDMIGFGASAIGYVDNSFFQNNSKPSAYENAINESGMSIHRGLRLTKDDLIRQYLITSLMCNFQVGFRELIEKFGIDYATYFAAEHARLQEFFNDGFIMSHADKLSVTPLGRTFIRNIAMTFDRYLSPEQTAKQQTFSRTI